MTELDNRIIPPGATVVHQPHGFVALLEAGQSPELAVVNAARASYAKHSTADECQKCGGTGTIPDPDRGSGWGPYWDHECPTCHGQGSFIGDADAGLIRFLLKHKHGTPFEMATFRFAVRAPIFVFREWHRHRIGISINEESARYVPMQPDFYLPDAEHLRRQEGKAGAYHYVPLDNAWLAEHGTARLRETPDVVDAIASVYDHAYATYTELVNAGVAKELARTVLPVGLYSTMHWACNARSLMSFLSLRNDPRAQREIRDYAQALEGIFAKVMPITHAAFIENERVAP